MSALLGGAGAALLIGIGATLLGLDRERAFYPTVLAVIASYYGLFALMAGDLHSLVAECIVMGLFVLLVALGYRRSLWLIVFALAAHGLFDAAHGRLIANPGMPPWWPAMCAAYDLVAAAYLALLLRRRRVPARA